MALQTVKLLSGYEFLSFEEVGVSRGLIKDIQTNSQTVSIYYDTVSILLNAAYSQLGSLVSCQNN